jgi:hypothetical protein
MPEVIFFRTALYNCFMIGEGVKAPHAVNYALNAARSSMAIPIGLSRILGDISVTKMAILMATGIKNHGKKGC